MVEDVLAVADESLEGRPLLSTAMRNGHLELDDDLPSLRARAAAESPPCRTTCARQRATAGKPLPSAPIPRLLKLTAAVQAITDPEHLARLADVAQHGST